MGTGVVNFTSLVGIKGKDGSTTASDTNAVPVAPIVGQSGVDGGAGATTAKTQRVQLSDESLAAMGGGAAPLVVTGSASTVGANIITETDVGDYAWVSLRLTFAPGNVAEWRISNTLGQSGIFKLVNASDTYGGSGSKWVASSAVEAVAGNSAIFHGPLTGKIFQVKVASGSAGGTINATAVFFPRPRQVGVLQETTFIANSELLTTAVTNLGSGLSTLGHGQIAITTTEVALPPFSNCKSVAIKAMEANTSPIYIGETGVTTGTAAEGGWELSARDSIELDVADTVGLFAISGSGTQRLCWVKVA